VRQRPEQPASPEPRRFTRPVKPPLRLFTTTLWEYPSQHYDSPNVGRMQGDAQYAGATPSWVIWQLLQRYTREGDTVLDPMCGSGTTLDVCTDLRRKGLGFDLNPQRHDITLADARQLPLADQSVDFAFVDPPYSTHIDYSNDPRCIGKLDAGGADHGAAYYAAMTRVLEEFRRVLRPRRYLAIYVSDSWRKRAKGDPGRGTGEFMPIGFELFAIARRWFRPVDQVCVVRQNAKLERTPWHKSAEEGNYFLRGFNHLLIFKHEPDEPAQPKPR
jgi:DNA modification methylase